MEETIGTPLFYREKNRLRLTQDGLFLKERAEEILTLDEKLEQAFSAQRKEQLSGIITIGCVEADNSDTLAMILEELISDYPQIRFNLVTGTSDDISDRLEKGILDMSILIEPIVLNEVEVLSLPREENWGFLVSKELFIANKNVLRPEDIKGLPILCSGRSEVQKLLAEWSKIPYDQLNIVGNYNLIFNILPLVDRKLENSVFIPLEPSIKTNCVLVWKKRVQTPAAQELINRFKHAFKL